MTRAQKSEAAGQSQPSATEQQVAAEVEHAAAVGNADHQQAAGKRAAAVAGLDQRTANEVAGLLEERRGYVTRGLDDRVAQVDEQLRLRGATPPKSSGKEG